MDEGIESTTFKMCIISSMFVEYHALPTRPGKTEIKMLQTAFAMRTSILFEVFQTFIQHVWTEQEKFFVRREEFVAKMSQYPLSHFLMTSTFRKMIELRMPDQAQSIIKKTQRVIREAGPSGSNVQLLENKSRPNLDKYRHKPQMYEVTPVETTEKMNLSMVHKHSSDKQAMMMAASTAS